MLAKYSFYGWLLCVLFFVGIFFVALVKNIQVELSNTYVLYMILIIFLGTLFFGIWSIASVYKSRNLAPSALNIFIFLPVLPLFLLWNVIKSEKIIQKVKILLITVVIALPVWTGWYFLIFKIIPDQILTFVRQSSMEPFGFPEGTKIIILPFLSCKEGDVCAFRCLKNKCNKNESYLKNVEKKKGDKYWLTGRKDEWECNDVEGEGLCYSFDSSSEYGWVKDGKDVHIQGRVVKNPF